MPLYYENRIPELQLINDDLNEDMERLLEEAELDESQEKKLEREFAREYHLISRDPRLEAIAKDLVDHFTGRGFQGKAMKICIDKATAIRMYDKVKRHWGEKVAGLKTELKIRKGRTGVRRSQEEIKALYNGFWGKSGGMVQVGHPYEFEKVGITHF